MHNSFKKILLGAGTLLFLAACQTYNTNFPTPPQNASIEEIVPEQIGDWKPRFAKAENIGGMRALYGENILGIQVTRLPNFESASLAFQSAIKPLFNQMPKRFSTSMNGNWTAGGTDHTGRKWYAWNNENYIFILDALNEKHFELLLTHFKYISK